MYYEFMAFVNFLGWKTVFLIFCKIKITTKGQLLILEKEIKSKMINKILKVDIKEKLKYANGDNKCGWV